MASRDRRHRSRFRKEEDKKDEEEFSVTNRTPRQGIDLSRNMFRWAPLVIAAIVAWYFIDKYLIRG